MSDSVPGDLPSLASGGDANDYKRFENIDDSSDDDELKERAAPVLSVSESILKAQAAKSAGNDAFTKEKNLDLARKHYAEGIAALEAHKVLDAAEHMSEPEQVEIRSLLVSLHGNEAMISLKEEKWSATIASADCVLRLDADNVKARYRRGLAHGKSGDFERAKEDLNHCLKVEPSNALAKKELALVTKLHKELLKKEKEAYANLFKGKSVYEDKEKERAEKAKKEELALLKEKDEYTQSKLSRRAKGLEEQTFEEWKEAKRVELERAVKEAEDDGKACAERMNKLQDAQENGKENGTTAAAAASPQSPPAAKSVRAQTAKSNQSKKMPEDEEEDLYDEEDAKIIAQTTSKGYCYFRNEQAPEVKSLIGDITPKTVAASEEDSAAATVTPSTTTDAGGCIGVSSWNKAGTWEERDTSALMKQRVTELCWETPEVKHLPFGASGGDHSNAGDSMQELMASLSSFSDTSMGGNTEAAMEKLSALTSGATARVSGVKSVEGDAQIVMARGKKRHIYEVSFVVDFDVVIAPVEDAPAPSGGEASASSKKSKFKGSITFTEVSPDTVNAPDCVLKFGKKSPVGTAHESKAKAAAEELKRGVIAKIQQFHKEYLAM